MDLLLDLAERQRIDLGQLSFADLAGQFVAECEGRLRGMPLERRADWLVIAARLLLLRSRLLVPAHAAAAEEAGRDARAELERLGQAAHMRAQRRLSRRQCLYETAVLATLRDKLRSGDVWVERSANYRRFDSYLVPQDAVPVITAGLKLPATADEWLAGRAGELDRRLKRFSRRLLRGELEGVELRDGRLQVTPVKATAAPEARCGQGANSPPHRAISHRCRSKPLAGSQVRGARTRQAGQSHPDSCPGARSGTRTVARRSEMHAIRELAGVIVAAVLAFFGGIACVVTFAQAGTYYEGERAGVD